jgi:hypothetical protein
MEMTKLLGVTLDCKRSCSKHIDTVVAKMGRRLVPQKKDIGKLQLAQNMSARLAIGCTQS